MSLSSYRTSPDHTDTGWPRGVKYIVGNEGCERFSFYGMKAILYVYLAHLYQLTGAEGAENLATADVHLFIALTYGLGLIGAILAEKLLGKYKTILWLSIVYCIGHGALAVFEGSMEGTRFGLFLIAVGAGGIKPCVSSHVGDQFGRANWFRIERVFQYFYWIINFGAFFSTLLIPWIMKEYGYSIAFAIPGILMLVATVFFWLGRKVFIHVPPSPGNGLGFMDMLIGTILSMVVLIPLIFGPAVGMNLFATISIALFCLIIGVQLFNRRQRRAPDSSFLAVVMSAMGLSPHGRRQSDPGKYKDHWFFARAARVHGEKAIEGPHAVFRVCGIFLFVSVFWALFDQHASSWVRQAKMMDLNVDLGFWQGTLLASQISAANPIMVMALIPLTSFAIYPAITKLGFTMTPLRRMTMGMIVASLSFVYTALLQAQLEAGVTLSVGWQIISYLIITLAEVMVSITGLEFAYTQAPKSMKSIIMGFWLLSVSFGNVIAAFIFKTFKDLSLSETFWVFAGLMMVAGIIFGIISYFYQYQEFPQE